MSLESRKVLDMVAAGKITADDAEKLLAKLGSPGVLGEGQPEESAKNTSAAPKRYLRIMVEEPGKKQVNIRMPLTFARSGFSMVGMLPRSVAEKLKERGINLEQLRYDNVELLNQLDLDIDKGDGKKVRIFCE